MKAILETRASLASAKHHRTSGRSASAAITRRTWPPSGTASITSGLSSIRACIPRGVLPGRGSARNTRPVASSLTSSGRPWASTLPLCKTTTCAHRSASSKYEVLSSTVRPCSLTSCRIIAHSSRRESGSTPTVGSSRSNSSGERISVQARPSFCFIPPESRPAKRWRKGRAPSFPSSADSAARRSSAPTPCRSA